VSLESVEKVAKDLGELNWCNGPTFIMPVLREDWVQAMAD